MRLFYFSLSKCGVYWRAAFKRGNTVRDAFILRKSLVKSGEIKIFSKDLDRIGIFGGLPFDSQTNSVCVCACACVCVCVCVCACGGDHLRQVVLSENELIELTN